MAKNAKSTSVFDVTDIIPDAESASKVREPKTKTEAPAKKKGSTNGGIQRAYYLQPEIIKAINIMSATEDIDKNEIVNTALRFYLAEYLK